MQKNRRKKYVFSKKNVASVIQGGNGPYSSKTDYIRGNIRMAYDLNDTVGRRTVSEDKLYDNNFIWSEVN